MTLIPTCYSLRLPAVLFLLRDLLVLAHSGARFDRERWRFGGVLRRAVALLAMTGVRLREEHAAVERILKGAMPLRGLLRRLAPPRNDGGALLFQGSAVVEEAATSGWRLLAVTGEGWKGGTRCCGGLLKRAMPLRGLLRRTCVLLAMTRVSWKGRGRCREVNHPEPFLMKRPTPPQEGNGGDCNLKESMLLRRLPRRASAPRSNSCFVAQ